jgi:hypothetical protein
VVGRSPGPRFRIFCMHFRVDRSRWTKAAFTKTLANDTLSVRRLPYRL